MKQEHFEILLERMEGNFQLAFEKFDLVDSRFEKIDARFEQMDSRFEQIDTRFARVDSRLDRLEVGQESMKVDIRDIKRTVGLLHSIANDHQTHLQNVETTLRDHLDHHS